ncbi:Bisphosphoglycerate-independent phosphoglycerate mutase [Carpediemonas membranifera]|uniref:Bisphosphoglycerate-independent phosphoglycerate mutase n=1 Tax=Carpediemonas membranifera TaxID=201153 RepID=A0A8J6B0W3_9EUKA|nr:Bisphosphoglycerate-independent phosphoglycerate mutase [Carpediemonas membranifera]|eukprot:KAG9391879.1 Bisphosphoglycerate-independent phosphoglycerate mutase [Carpediemonas membranifera]
MGMKVVYLLLDGVGDCPLQEPSEWKGRTPLEIAKTPNLDAIAARGVCGMVDPVAPGKACGSDTAHLNLFGYPPEQYYVGRGCYETLGAGMRITPQDVAFKSNFATIEGTTVTKRRADRSFEHEGPILAGLLDGTVIPGFPDLSIKVMYTTEHRCAVAIVGPGLSDKITGTDPLVDDRPLCVSEPLDSTAEARKTADALNTLTKEVTRKLETHPINVERRARGKNPANLVLFRGPGSLAPTPPVAEKYGIKGAVIAPTAIIRGVAESVGFDLPKLPKEATGGMDSDFKVKVAAVLDALDEYDFVFVHFKGIDDASHEGDSHEKVRQIERVDAAIAPLLERNDVVLVLSGDHSTPCIKKDHSFESVPFVYCDPVASADAVTAYTEKECAKGDMGRFPGDRVMPLIVSRIKQ